MGRLDHLYKAELPHRAKLVYIYLYDRQDKEKKAWPGIKTIASDLSLSRSTVKRAIKDLENAGMIRKEAHYRENGSATSTGIICFCARKRNRLADRLPRSIQEGSPLRILIA